MDRYFYIVEECNGHKEIHFSGNIYYNDADWSNTCFRIAEWTGLFITVDQLKKLIAEDALFEYLHEKVAYLGDLTEDEAVEACQVYFNGEPGIRKHIRYVDEDTPCGDYWFE